DGADPRANFLTQAVGDREHELPVRRRPIHEAFGLSRLGKAKGVATVLRPPGELAAHPGKAGIVEVTEVVDLLASEAPLHLNEDGAAQHGVGHLLALERDRLRAERREPPRLIRIGVAPHYALPACPPTIDDLP